MKRIPLLIVILVLVLPVSGQLADQNQKPPNLPAFDLKRLHFGFTVGLNAMDLAIQRNYLAEDFIYADVSQLGYGFQVSIVSDLRISDNWNLRFLPGISFSQVDISYYELDDAGPGDLVEVSGAANPVEMGPARLDFPLLFKYRSKRVNNVRPYLVAGAAFRYNLAAKRGYDDESNEYMRLKPGSFCLEFGFGLDTYLRYFKFSPEIKLSVGLNDLHHDEPREPNEQFVTSIDRITPFLVMINFHFE